MPVVITGASDDLIEIDGDIREEFTYRSDDPEWRGDVLGFSDGTVLRITYTPLGVWRIGIVERGAASLVVEQAPEGDESNYSDKATLDGDVRWVVHGVNHAAVQR